MKADLTRNTFDRFKHRTRVLMQQGRVQLDADSNEQTSIILHYLHTLAADLIGPEGGPLADCGFAIGELAVATLPAITDDFRIGLGHYYVDGILCEADSAPINVFGATANQTVQVDTWSEDGIELQKGQYLEAFDAADPTYTPTVVLITKADKPNMQLTLQGLPTPQPVNPQLRRVITYLTQPDYPVTTAPVFTNGGVYQVYLDVWERHLTYAEDDTMREVALGGPDTATRAKLVWQVKLLQVSNNEEACTPFQDLNAMLQPAARGRLRARARQASPSTDPCIINPNASYQGPENQLYRVEINRPGKAWDGTAAGKNTAATFKWSRENGAVVFPIISGAGGNQVTLENLGRDDRFGLSVGDWVEVQTDSYVLQNLPATLLQVQAIDRTMSTVTLSGPTDPKLGVYPQLHPLLRRWDHTEGDPAEGGLTLGSDGAALIEEGLTEWLDLENGVQVQFVPLDELDTTQVNQYFTADYWQIPARTATGDVEWPQVTDAQGNLETDAQGNPMPLPMPPDGVHHHYAPLAWFGVNTNGLPSPNDCRKMFSPVIAAQTKAKR